MEPNGDPPTAPKAEGPSQATLHRHLTSTNCDEIVQGLKMIEVYPNLLTSVSIDVLKGTLSHLTATLPEVIRPHIGAVIKFCHQVVHSPEKKECYRDAIHLLATVCQQGSNAIPDDTLPVIVASCLQMMVVVDVDEDISIWMAGKESRVENAEWGKNSFSRIEHALFKTNIVNVTIQLTAQILQDELQHPRVRDTACAIFNRMAFVLGPNLNHKHLHEMVPALMTTMADTSTPRVASHAALALRNIVINHPAEIVSNHIQLINVIKSSLEEVARMPILSSMNDQFAVSQLHIVDELALHIINKTAPSHMTPGLFATIYERLIDPIIRILKARDSSFLLCIAALTSLTNMNTAVGKSKCLKNAAEVLQACALLLDSMGNSERFMLPLKRYCNSLGDGIGPFLPLIMPRLMQNAICLADLHNREKMCNSCCRYKMIILDDFAIALGDKFAPYVDDVSRVVIHNLTTCAYASPALPQLMKCIKHQGLPAIRALWLSHWNALKQAFKVPGMRFLYGEWLWIVKSAVELLGPEGIPMTEISEIGEVMKSILLGSDGFVSHRDNEEDAILTEMVTMLLKTVGANSFATIHSLMPVMFVKMGAGEDGVRAYTSYIEHAPEMAFVYRETIRDLLLASLTEERPEYRSTGAWALGHIALLKRPQWAPMAIRSLPLLAEAIALPESTQGIDCTRATENAVSAVIKIIKHCEGVDMDKWLPCFLDWILVHGLQYEQDYTETPHVYRFLAQLIEERHPFVMGQNKANWMKIVRNLIQMLHRIKGCESIEVERTYARLLKIIRNMKMEDERLFDQCVAEAGFNEWEKKTLALLMS